MEKERDFYFDKLRSVELMCQSEETPEMIKKQSVLDILYATEVRFCHLF